MVFADDRRYRVWCWGLVCAALAREVLGEGQSGVYVKFDVVGAVAVVLVCSSAP